MISSYNKKKAEILLPLILLGIAGVILLFFSDRIFFNETISLQIYAFILSTLCIALVLLFFIRKRVIVIQRDYLSITILGFILYLTCHNVITSENPIPMICPIVFLSLFFLFKNYRSGNLFAYLVIIICISQAVWGMGQYFNLFQHSYAVKGGFDNPAGFAALLIAGLPFCFSLGSFSKKEKIARYVSLSILIPTLALSYSRAGIISAIGIVLYFFIVRFKTIIIAKSKLLLPIVGFLLIISCFYLFGIKKDSANGRILIWQNSC